MTRMLFIGRKRADLIADEFVMYWQQIHAPLVRAIPGIRRYVIYPVIGFHAETPVCDGLDEMWFDTRQSLEDGLASKEGQAMVFDLANFCSAESGAVVVSEIDIPCAGAAASRSFDDGTGDWEDGDDRPGRSFA